MPLLTTLTHIHTPHLHACTHTSAPTYPFTHILTPTVNTHKWHPTHMHTHIHLYTLTFTHIMHSHCYTGTSISTALTSRSWSGSTCTLGRKTQAVQRLNELNALLTMASLTLPWAWELTSQEGVCAVASPGYLESSSSAPHSGT